MAIVNGYATLPEFRAYARELAGVTVDDEQFEEAIETASRWIDDYCGRRFYVDAEASARVFRPTDRCTVDVADISTTTGLIVKTDTVGDGTYATTITDYQLEPLNGIVEGIEGWPYTRIRALGSTTFPTGVRPGVQVTATWGWPAVPKAVYRACLLVALEHYRLRDVPFGVMGMGDFATRIRNNPAVTNLLDRYRTSRAAVPSV